MRHIISTLLATFLMSAGQVALAQDPGDLYLGDPAYGGSGCPAGSAAAVLSPDKRTLSILFDEYIAQAGGMIGVSIDRKSCNIAVPVHVPQGYSISVFQVDYRGFNFLPRGSSSRFDAEYFFAGQRGPRFSRNFRGPIQDEYLIENDVIGIASVWSRCGTDVNLRANTGMFVFNPSRTTEAISSVDSADVQAALVYHLRWRRC